MNHEFPAGDPRYWHWPSPENTMTHNSVGRTEARNMISRLLEISDELHALGAEQDELYDALLKSFPADMDDQPHTKQRCCESPDQHGAHGAATVEADPYDRTHEMMWKARTPIDVIDISPRKIHEQKYPSSKQDGVVWCVEEWSDGMVTCTCPGFHYREDCKHVKNYCK